jgi:hypothetical protein
MDRKIEKAEGRLKTFAISVSTGTIRRRREVDITHLGGDRIPPAIAHHQEEIDK